jgi:hypothetical protein
MLCHEYMRIVEVGQQKFPFREKLGDCIHVQSIENVCLLWCAGSRDFETAMARPSQTLKVKSFMFNISVKDTWFENEFFWPGHTRGKCNSVTEDLKTNPPCEKSSSKWHGSYYPSVLRIGKKVPNDYLNLSRILRRATVKFRNFLVFFCG